MSDDDFFSTQQMAGQMFDLGKCVHCGNHELFYTDSGTAYMWCRRDCCLPNALKRASAMAQSLQDGPEKCSDFSLVQEDLKRLTAEVQVLLSKYSDKRAALNEAKAKMNNDNFGVDIVGRILRNLEAKR
jgi:hypothetical protein